MKKILLSMLVFVVLIPGSVFAQGTPGDYLMQVLNTDGFSYSSGWFHTSKTGVQQFLIYDGTSTNGGAGTRAIGPHIMCSATACDVNTTVGATGPTGAAGTNGTNGVSPVLSVGTVTAGSAPSASMTGTSSAPILNFVLKNGVDGAAGAMGSTGPAGTTDYTLLSNKPDLSIYATSSALSSAIAGTYPLSGNPSAFLTSISSAQVTGALGFTPYSATNPAAYIALPAARAGISITTTGSGAATYNSSTGVMNVPTPATGGTTAITGTVAKIGSYRVYQSFTITTAGTAVFQMTADGTSTGSALFPNETFTDSVQPIVNDATASYQFGWTFSNSNKTLTLTVNKLTTANILTGVLGQAAAPVGTIVKVVVEGR